MKKVKDEVHRIAKDNRKKGYCGIMSVKNVDNYTICANHIVVWLGEYFIVKN